jgi:hypothetical protein
MFALMEYASMASVTLIGISGAKYVYETYDINTVWNPLPGNYAFADAALRIKYVGQTDNFAKRFSNHEKWPEAVKYGATQILARVNQQGEIARKAEETDLIRAYNPPCNVQQSSTAGLGTLSGLFGSGHRGGLLGGG